jgi:hypothetical protein
MSTSTFKSVASIQIFMPFFLKECTLETIFFVLVSFVQDKDLLGSKGWP